MSDLFTGSGQTDILEHLTVEGYDRPIVGTVYAENRLEWSGCPLGGLGTGYVTLDTDGRLGKWQIFNTYPQPMQQNATWLAVEVDGRQYVVACSKDGIGDAIAVRYFGHFPVVDAIFSFAGPLRVQVRAYGCFLPGNAIASNTPGILFDVRVANTDTTPVQLRITFGPEKMPAGRRQAFSYGSWRGTTVTHRWLSNTSSFNQTPPLHTYTVAGEEAIPGGSPERAAVSIATTARPGEIVRRKFALAWHQPNYEGFFQQARTPQLCPALWRCQRCGSQRYR